MTLQQLALSFQGRIGRRDFWVGFVVCIALFITIFIINEVVYPLPTIFIGILSLFILYPLCAIFTKRLHDRNKRGSWLFLLLLAVMLSLADTSALAPFWQWAMGRFLPSFIAMIIFLDCGVFIGTQGANYFGGVAQSVDYRRLR